MNVLGIVILVLLGIVVITIQQFVRIKMANFTSKIFDKLIKPKYQKRNKAPIDNDTAQ